MKLCIYLTILILSGVMIGCSSDDSYRGNLTGDSIKIEQKNYKPGLDLFLLIDESGSMIGPNGTDANGIRFDASKYLLQNLFIKNADKEFPNRVSIIHFSDEFRSSALKDVLTGNLNVLQQEIQTVEVPTRNTNIIGALKTVKQVFDSSPKYINRRDRAIVLFTDGKPEQKSNESIGQTIEQFNEIKNYFNNELKDYKLYVIGIDNKEATVKFSETIKYWRQIIPSENIVSIEQINDLYSKFNYAIEKILELKSTYENLVQDQGKFFVNPYVDNLEFHIFAKKHLKLSIFDPQNNLIKIDTTFSNVSQDGYIIHKIDNPLAGEWRYKLERHPEDKQPIRIVKNEIPFRLELLSPEPIFNDLGQRYFPLDKKVLIKAKFTKENGEEIKELQDYPLSFSARITSEDNPSFDKQLRFLTKNKAGVNYYADEYISFNKEGKYKIRLSVKGGNTVEFIQTEPIEILKIPYFELQEMLPLTEITPGSDIIIKVGLKMGNEKIEPSKFFVDNPNSAILSQIVRTPKNGGRSVALWMEQSRDDNSTLYAVFPSEKDTFETGEEGIYEFALDFKVKPLVDYRLFPTRVVSTFDIFVKKTFLLILLDYLLFIFGIFLLIVLLGAMYQGVKLYLKGVKYDPMGTTVSAKIEDYGITADSDSVEESRIPIESLQEEITLIDGNMSVNKYSRPVSLNLGKNKKGKAENLKLWVKPLDGEGKNIAIYKGSLISNLLFWKTKIAHLSEGSNSKTIKFKGKTIEVSVNYANSPFINPDVSDSDSPDENRTITF